MCVHFLRSSHEAEAEHQIIYIFTWQTTSYVFYVTKNRNVYLPDDIGIGETADDSILNGDTQWNHVTVTTKKIPC
jgi:hypothetical protein